MGSPEFRCYEDASPRHPRANHPAWRVQQGLCGGPPLLTGMPRKVQTFILPPTMIILSTAGRRNATNLATHIIDCLLSLIEERHSQVGSERFQLLPLGIGCVAKQHPTGPGQTLGCKCEFWIYKCCLVRTATSCFWRLLGPSVIGFSWLIP